MVSITVDKNNNYYSSDESGVLFNKEKTLEGEISLKNSKGKIKAIIPIATLASLEILFSL